MRALHRLPLLRRASDPALIGLGRPALSFCGFAWYKPARGARSFRGEQPMKCPATEFEPRRQRRESGSSAADRRTDPCAVAEDADPPAGRLRLLPRGVDGRVNRAGQGAVRDHPAEAITERRAAAGHGAPGVGLARRRRPVRGLVPAGLCAAARRTAALLKNDPPEKRASRFRSPRVRVRRNTPPERKDSRRRRKTGPAPTPPNNIPSRRTELAKLQRFLPLLRHVVRNAG